MASALGRPSGCPAASVAENAGSWVRSEEHTSELQSQSNLVCRLLLEKKKKKNNYNLTHSSPSSTTPVGIAARDISNSYLYSRPSVQIRVYNLVRTQVFIPLSCTNPDD